MHPEVIAPGTDTVQADSIVNALAYTLIETSKPLHQKNTHSCKLLKQMTQRWTLVSQVPRWVLTLLVPL